MGSLYELLCVMFNGVVYHGGCNNLGIGTLYGRYPVAASRLLEMTYNYICCHFPPSLPLSIVSPHSGKLCWLRDKQGLEWRSHWSPGLCFHRSVVLSLLFFFRVSVVQREALWTVMVRSPSRANCKALMLSALLLEMYPRPA